MTHPAAPARPAARAALAALALALALAAPMPVRAECGAPVCAVEPGSLRFSRLLDFDALASAPGVGRAEDALIVLDGASLGERFLGQFVVAEDTFDRLAGAAAAPLSLLAGAPGRSLGVLRLIETTVVHGLGEAGFPRTAAIGEGALAVLFERDQAAFGFDLRGGEGGSARLVILGRDARVIHVLRIGPLAEGQHAFLRHNSLQDIAGFTLVNDDPEGISLDNLRFEAEELLGLLTPGSVAPQTGQQPSETGEQGG